MPSIVSVPKFNTVLDERARAHYAPAIATMYAVAPDMMGRKFARANVQQAFMLSAILALSHNFPRTRIISVGCYEDTAYETLLKMGVLVDGIDPNVNDLDISKFLSSNPDRKGTYDIVFSTSVIEHVEDDEQFVRDMASLIAPGGYGILTCDFNDAWSPGDPVPGGDFRFYRSKDLGLRLLSAMSGCQLIDAPDWDGYEPDFEFANCRYSFAAFTVQKGTRA